MNKSVTNSRLLTVALSLLLLAETVTAGGWSCNDDTVKVSTDHDEVHEYDPYSWAGKIFSVTKNDGSNYEATGNYPGMQYQYDDSTWDDRAGTLKYLGAAKLDGYNVIAGNEFHEFGGYLFTPDISNKWTGYVSFEYRIEHTYYCVLTCTDWCSWGKVTIVVQPAEKPVPSDDVVTISQSEFKQYREGTSQIRMWPMDNDSCSWNDAGKPCISTDLILDTDDTAATTQYGDQGGRVERRSSENYWKKGPYYFVYFPPTYSTYAGEECFFYSLTEVEVDSDGEASVCFTVEGVVPVANDDTATTTTGTAVTIDVLGNDKLQNMTNFNFVVTFSNEEDSVLVDNGDGTITYTPPLTIQSGTITIPYTISDDWGTSTGDIVVMVEYEFSRTAIDDTITLVQGQQASIDISANDINAGTRDILNYYDTYGDMSNCLESKSWDRHSFIFSMTAKTEVVRTCTMHYQYMDYKDSVGTITVNIVAP